MLRVEHCGKCLAISQLEHARLARKLAGHWLALPEVLRECRSEWLEVVEHHDDGWVNWELSPRINNSGLLCAFDEMPPDESTLIWRESIRICQQISSRGGEWVRRHFLSLAERAMSHMAPGGEEHKTMSRFVDEQRVLSARLTSQPLADDPELLEAGYRGLKLFDALSLWVCLKQSPTETTIQVPGTGEVIFRNRGEAEWELIPSVLGIKKIPLKVTALELSHHHFASDAALREDFQNAQARTLRIDITGSA